MEGVEFGESGYAVVDVEAICLGTVYVVEQVACVIMSAATGNEIFAEKHIVFQPHDRDGIVAVYNRPKEEVDRGVDGYIKVTGDNPVHNDPSIHVPWNAVRNRLKKILRRRAYRIYAKGAGLERKVFGEAVPIWDLEWYNCPKYPEKIHDPLKECRFFARYIPELNMRPMYCTYAVPFYC